MAKKGAGKARVPDVIDVGADANTAVEDLALAKADGGIITGWLGNLAKFFTGAAELEQKAKATLAKVDAMKVPTNVDEDEKLQRTIKQIAQDQAGVEVYWDITKKVSALHRRLTAKRGIAEDALERAKKKANDLHNQWTANERRRVDEENRRREREARERAEREQQERAAELEREALKREAESPELSAREKDFVTNFTTVGGSCYSDATRSAQFAGYKNAAEQGARLAKAPKIQVAIKAALEANALRQQAAAVKAQPVDVEYQEVEPELSTAYGSDRTNWGGELLDERALMTAFLGCAPEDYKNRFGIPADLWMVNPKKLNEVARSLHERLDLWPGVRAKKNTQVV